MSFAIIAISKPEDVQGHFNSISSTIYPTETQGKMEIMLNKSELNQTPELLKMECHVQTALLWFSEGNKIAVSKGTM